jgi:cellulose synthase/poly-beta-1,6-N-acetylglucosamine synthase-like glycosyltransferase
VSGRNVVLEHRSGRGYGLATWRGCDQPLAWIFHKQSLYQAEDLAFSALLGTQGLRGLFLEHVCCYEDFPSTYLVFKRQYERYIIGTTQIATFLGPFLRSPRVSWTEKLDFCLWCVPLYGPALCLAFIVLCSLGLAGLLGHWSPVTVSVGGYHIVLPVRRVFDERFTALGSWDFQLFSVLIAFSPTFACLTLGFKQKLHALKLLVLSTVPYLSLSMRSQGVERACHSNRARRDEVVYHGTDW